MFFQALLSVFIFALVPLAIKVVNATPITICLFRLFLTVVVLGFIWLRKIHFKDIFTFQMRSLKLWSLGFVFFCHWISYVYAVKIGGASIGVIGLSTYGFQLLIASVVVFNHRMTRKDFLCLFFSLAGILMIVPSWNFKNDSTKGLALALLSATCFAILPILHKKLERHTLETRIFMQFFGAFIGFLFFIGKTNWHLETHDWWLLLYLALFGTLIAHGLWAKLSTAFTPSTTGLIYYTIAPITVFISCLFFGEKLTLVQLSGAIIVIGSAVLNLYHN